jgi:hypothetical protein
VDIAREEVHHVARHKVLVLAVGILAGLHMEVVVDVEEGNLVAAVDNLVAAVDSLVVEDNLVAVVDNLAVEEVDNLAAGVGSHRAVGTVGSALEAVVRMEMVREGRVNVLEEVGIGFVGDMDYKAAADPLYISVSPQESWNGHYEVSGALEYLR